MKKFVLLACVSLFTPLNTNAFADDYKSDQLSVGLGYYDILDDDGAADFRIEYRGLSVDLIGDLHPWAGIELTSDASFWAGAGLLYDYEFSDNWYITPSFGAGYYAQGSSDLDLSNTLQFRSQIEAGYSFEDNTRLSVAFSHISNASLDDSNPGTEILNVYYGLPF